MEHSAKEQHGTEQNQWDSLLNSTFGVEEHAQDKQCESAPSPAEMPLQRKKWLWPGICVFLVVVLAVVCCLPYLTPRDNTFPPELEICREKLARWQNLQGYQITCSMKRYNADDCTEWEEKYWNDGKNWLLIHTFNEKSGEQKRTGYLVFDEKTYYYAGGETMLWQRRDIKIPVTLELWPMIFSWEDCELTFRSERREEANQVISFSVKDRDTNRVYSDKSPYYVEFTLDHKDNLVSVKLIYLRENGFIAEDNYNLTGTDFQEISEFIQSQDILALNTKYNEQ